MDEPVILITGALTGIGRAAVIAFAKTGGKVVVAGRRDEAGQALAENSAPSVRSQSSSMPTSAWRMMSALWSTRPSNGSAVSTSR